MMSLKEIIAGVKLGCPLEALIPEGSDINYWRRIVANRLAQEAKPKRRYSGTSRPRTTRRRLSAAEGLARTIGQAMAEQVERVNSEAPNA